MRDSHLFPQQKRRVVRCRSANANAKRQQSPRSPQPHHESWLRGFPHNSPFRPQKAHKNRIRPANGPRTRPRPGIFEPAHPIVTKTETDLNSLPQLPPSPRHIQIRSGNPPRPSRSPPPIINCQLPIGCPIFLSRRSRRRVCAFEQLRPRQPKKHNASCKISRPRPNVEAPWTDDPVVLLLLDDVGGPAGDSGAGEEGRV
jgi:hypothetical protein